MFFSRDMDPTKHHMTTESAKYSLPELYASVENFNRERKKSNLLKTQGISLDEAQKMLIQNLVAMSFISRTDVRDLQPVFKAKVERKVKPASMTDLLHRSLLTRSLSPLEKLSKSRQRLAQYGISPPVHTFPYDIILHHASSLALTEIRKKVQRTLTVGRLGLHKITSEQLIVDDRVPKYLLVDPEKQFLDLRDLEWRYYKGIVKWKRNTLDSTIEIKYNSEKRFVQSQQMPDTSSPPLVHRSLIIYPQVDFLNVPSSS
ncbi:uncharacterized protein C9orf153 homolog isoform X2 [Talpa occidentalis]|nr:uncharacterized protein C9orf153 homolog isoform X2 [Talpa occidentalis]XP_054544901.1 uncharacterized protein C9orf153 homolog isoform X2 [Talpa occidentalis]XP_054544902.1 uncharacterized protein C9orf153 homolog isoform X2 [Talpa occidentalis]XP_054544903.1 uncharacterized protein C9orf153 homolog isoform X2 [Talpa occidentalis]XP_054544904.1 uncharacterized protein C9orf153 homolog isoform X2 [Talpa occidentalis]